MGEVTPGLVVDNQQQKNGSSARTPSRPCILKVFTGPLSVTASDSHHLLYPSTNIWWIDCAFSSTVVTLTVVCQLLQQKNSFVNCKMMVQFKRLRLGGPGLGLPNRFHMAMSLLSNHPTLILISLLRLCTLQGTWCPLSSQRELCP